MHIHVAGKTGGGWIEGFSGNFGFSGFSRHPIDSTHFFASGFFHIPIAFYPKVCYDLLATLAREAVGSNHYKQAQEHPKRERNSNMIQTRQQYNRSNTIAAFKTRAETETAISCAVTGILTTFHIPTLPPLPLLSFAGLHPLANATACRALASYKYSEEHHKLAPTILAGAILSILADLQIRDDHIHAVEANAILSNLPLFTLSQVLSFAASLEPRHTKRIPHISLEEKDPETLTRWHADCIEAFASSISERQTYQAPPVRKAQATESALFARIRKDARILFNELKDSDVLPSKLSNVIGIALQGRNMLTVSDSLRSNIAKALLILDTEETKKLASIFSTIKEATEKEEKARDIVFLSSIEKVSDSFTDDKKPKTIKELLAKRKEQAEGQACEAATQVPQQETQSPTHEQPEAEYEDEREYEYEEDEPSMLWNEPANEDGDNDHENT
jgi:hypothetical protein